MLSWSPCKYGLDQTDSRETATIADWGVKYRPPPELWQTVVDLLDQELEHGLVSRRVEMQPICEERPPLWCLLEFPPQIQRREAALICDLLGSVCVLFCSSQSPLRLRCALRLALLEQQCVALFAASHSQVLVICEKTNSRGMVIVHTWHVRGGGMAISTLSHKQWPSKVTKVPGRRMGTLSC